MPNIRVETRPSVAANVGQLFGPWPHDILVRGLQFTVSFAAILASRLGRIGGTMFGQASHALEIYPSGNAVLNDAAIPSCLCSAVPGAGVSCTHDVTSGTLSPMPRWSFSIPYNWIIPAQGIVYVHLDGFQAGDTIGTTTLWYEIGATRQARPKKGAPPSSKNNP